MTKQELTQWIMYHEIHQMKRQGCSMRKITEKLGVSYRKVKDYLCISEDEFFAHLRNMQYRNRKLSQYEEFVRSRLVQYPETSSAQMHDWLKEAHIDFPIVCEKTIYNFVVFVRQKYNIPQECNTREFFPVEELPYGKQAQVDFGEYNLKRSDGSRKKVYFFSMILSRSRQRFVDFSDTPFTTAKAIMAHEKAFSYFQGIPLEIVYDQDKVFISDENKGDFLLTRDFKAYTQHRNFVLHFCRKADPQSKGKIENTIKYIKQNFLYNRQFYDIDTLNEQALQWLSRTANTMIHHTTRKIPFNEWQTEKTHLKPYIPMTIPSETYLEYDVRINNTIAYKGNFYTLPQGTYTGKKTKVLLQINQEKINIYNQEKEIICTHLLCLDKGKLISNNNHKRNNQQKIDTFIIQLSELFEQEQQEITQYLQRVRENYPRYIRDHLMGIKELIDEYGTPSVYAAIRFCKENNIFSATDIKSVIIKQQDNMRTNKHISPTIKLMISPETLQNINAQPKNSNIDDYEILISN